MFRYVKFLSVSVSLENTAAYSLCGKEAPRDSTGSTKKEGSPCESGKPVAQGKFLLAGIRYLDISFSKSHLCVSTHVISMQHSC